MKKKAAFLGVLLSMLMMASSAWAADFTVARDMNFRAAPAVTGQRIGSVPKGAVVSKIGEMNGWDNVTYRGVTGWIHGGNLMTAEQAARRYKDGGCQCRDEFPRAAEHERTDSQYGSRRYYGSLYRFQQRMGSDHLQRSPGMDRRRAYHDPEFRSTCSGSRNSCGGGTGSRTDRFGCRHA